jgi:uncharacterized protein YecE (DUF72 family)
VLLSRYDSTPYNFPVLRKRLAPVCCLSPNSLQRLLLMTWPRIVRMKVSNRLQSDFFHADWEDPRRPRHSSVRRGGCLASLVDRLHHLRTAVAGLTFVIQRTTIAHMTEFRIGTSAFTAAGWETAFYPAGTKPADYLSYYATKFHTVEVDSTFYRTPSVATVNGWERKIPKGFLLAAKVPQIITHQNVLQDCDEDLKHFLETMDLVGDKLGPLLFQFGYFNQTVFRSGEDFLSRLQPFLKNLPKGYKFAVEIRNKNWLSKPFFDLLRAHKVAYALIDQAWMPRPSAIFEKFDPVTADFTCLRLLGDRKGIEQKTKVWDKVIVDRSKELMSWVNVCQRTVRRGVSTYVHVNNHYAGFAPATVEQFEKLWKVATRQT